MRAPTLAVLVAAVVGLAPAACWPQAEGAAAAQPLTAPEPQGQPAPPIPVPAFVQRMRGGMAGGGDHGRHGHGVEREGHEGHGRHGGQEAQGHDSGHRGRGGGSGHGGHGSGKGGGHGERHEAFHHQMLNRLDLIEVRLAKIEAMLERLMQR